MFKRLMLALAFVGTLSMFGVGMTDTAEARRWGRRSHVRYYYAPPRVYYRDRYVPYRSFYRGYVPPYYDRSYYRGYPYYYGRDYYYPPRRGIYFSWGF